VVSAEAAEGMCEDLIRETYGALQLPSINNSSSMSYPRIALSISRMMLFVVSFKLAIEESERGRRNPCMNWLLSLGSILEL